MSQEGFIAKGRPEALFKLQTCANNVRIATSTIFTYLYCKIPFIYVQLLTFMVKLYLVVIAVIAGSNIRVAKSHLERILPIFLVIVSNCAYEGILQVNVAKFHLVFTSLPFPPSLSSRARCQSFCASVCSDLV